MISNVGSFGESAFKVGMTRRLVPQERVDELGDASFPFTFDVHMMIRSDDAPSLESSLHKELHKYRVNRVNFRKEFFRVDLETIKAAVEQRLEERHRRGQVTNQSAFGVSDRRSEVNFGFCSG